MLARNPPLLFRHEDQGLGLGGLGFRGFRVLGLRVWGLGFRVFRVWGLGFGVQGWVVFFQNSCSFCRTVTDDWIAPKPSAPNHDPSKLYRTIPKSPSNHRPYILNQPPKTV